MNLKETFKELFDTPFTRTNIKKKLLEASSEYYNTEVKIMSDEYYDKLREFYEKKFDEELPVGAPVANISNRLELSHNYKDFAGTLSKCQNLDDLDKWVKNKGVNPDELLVSIKADGHSITIEWVWEIDGLYIDKVLTRGENGVGKDLTSIFKQHEHLVPKPPVQFNCAVGYEAVVKYSRFDNLLTAGADYKNPRSAVGGILSNSGKQYFMYLDFLPLRIKAQNPKHELYRAKEGTTYTTYLEVLKKMKNSDILDFQIMSLEEIRELYNTHEDMRKVGGNVDILYDGLVIESIDEDKRKELGFSSTEPNFATAIKFSPQEKDTILTDIEWSCEGHSGRLTPKAHFTPVVVRGNTYVQVSLANLERFNSMELRKNDHLLFTLRNDTLGYIDKIETSKVNKNPLFEAPVNCPSCNEPLKVSKFLDCINEDCENVYIGKIFGFLEKIGVKGIGRSTLNSIAEKYDIDIYSMLTLTKEDLEDDFSELFVSNLVDAINDVVSKPMRDNILIGSLGIPTIGRDRAMSFLQVHSLKDVLEWASLPLKEFEKMIGVIEGVGKKTISNLYEGLNENLELIEELMSVLDIQESKVTTPVVANGKSLSFCHTGESEPFSDREAIKLFLMEHGHKLVSGVSKKTDYLVSNVVSGTVKFTKAKDLGIPIITCEDLIKVASGDSVDVESITTKEVIDISDLDEFPS